MIDAADAKAMAHALQLAERGLYTTDPNPRVGCVIVKDGVVVGASYHERAGEPHAEARALRQAADKARGATVYVTLEPCCHQGRTPPCTSALIDARVYRVVAAMPDPNPKVAGKGLMALQAAGIEVDVGLMQAQAAALNPGFIQRMQSQRPYVRIKLAASLDGRTAMANGESKWITGDAARNDVQRWRARSSAIITGIGTVRTDDPSLNVRNIKTTRQPLRVVLDSQLMLSPLAKILNGAGNALVVTASKNAKSGEILRSAGAEVLYLPGQKGQIDLSALMRHLTAREMNEILIEAGPTLSGAMLEGGLVDEIILYFAPHLLGNSARGLFALPGVAHLAQRIALTIIDVRPIGEDWRMIARVINKNN